MNMEKPYEPTPEETQKTEEMMTDEQKEMSENREKKILKETTSRTRHDGMLLEGKYRERSDFDGFGSSVYEVSPASRYVFDKGSDKPRLEVSGDSIDLAKKEMKKDIYEKETRSGKKFVEDLLDKLNVEWTRYDFDGNSRYKLAKRGDLLRVTLKDGKKIEGRLFFMDGGHKSGDHSLQEATYGNPDNFSTLTLDDSEHVNRAFRYGGRGRIYYKDVADIEIIEKTDSNQ